MESEIGAVSYDHGAQFFTARSTEFQREVAELQAAGVVAEWTGRHARITADGSCQLLAQTRSTSSNGGAGFCGSLDGLPLYVGTPTNSALCQHLGQQLAQQQGVIVEQGVKVQAVERLGGGCGTSGSRWRLRGTRQGRGAADAGTDGQEDLGAYDTVVLADGMTLLPGSAGHISGIEQAATSLAQLAASVAAATPQPCFALMLAWRQPLPGVPFDSASFDAGSSSSVDGSSGSRGASSGSSSAAFQWIACDSSKPGRPQDAQCWVALTSPQRTQQLLESYPLVVDGKFQPQTEQLRAAVAAELLSDFTALMQPFVEGVLPPPASCHAQRWGRAFVASPLGAEFLFLPSQRLALCGDVTAGSSIESAWRSGRAAGDAVAAMLLASAL
ncbi:hypothetical protein D9Q98_002725 [Chlorella vulgaris]|uniref:Amine oxidase domain-containing protein n=1 Tax=Chlorella vulgaris TaxID=3077 RepID=A0A9D4YZQ6_CHLVU|nr:hypothetical protein D9Q98_002725 [Chlorella vulgaris]